MIQVLIPSILISMIIIFLVCEIVNISVFKQYNKDKNILDFYRFQRLLKINSIDLSYSLRVPVIDGYNRYYHIKILGEDKIILFECNPIPSRINTVYLVDEIDGKQTNIKYELPLGRASWLLSYRMNKIEKYMEVAKLEYIKEGELSKEVNKHLITYTRDNRLKKLGL